MTMSTILIRAYTAVMLALLLPAKPDAVVGSEKH